MDGWMNGWMDAWMEHAERHKDLGKAGPKRGRCRGCRQCAKNTGASEDAGDAGNAAGLQRISSVLKLPPARFPMAARALMMRQGRWASRRCALGSGTSWAVVLRKLEHAGNTEEA